MARCGPAGGTGEAYGGEVRCRGVKRPQPLRHRGCGAAAAVPGGAPSGAGAGASPGHPAVPEQREGAVVPGAVCRQLAEAAAVTGILLAVFLVSLIFIYCCC